MFTGIVTAVGTGAARARDGRRRARAHHRRSLSRPGRRARASRWTAPASRWPGSRPGGFTAHVVRTSLERTAFADVRRGRRVNLERALRVGDRLGGHLVQGHVDGVGTVERVAEHATTPASSTSGCRAEVARVSVPLGSITVDGVSLTVNAIPAPGPIQISLIPFTLQHTTLGERRAGDRVHLEADTIGKYVAELLQARRTGNRDGSCRFTQRDA